MGIFRKRWFGISTGLPLVAAASVTLFGDMVGLVGMFVWALVNSAMLSASMSDQAARDWLAGDW